MKEETQPTWVHCWCPLVYPITCRKTELPKRTQMVSKRKSIARQKALYRRSTCNSLSSYHSSRRCETFGGNEAFSFTRPIRSRLLGASICVVPLSQPIPVKNYFQNRLSRKINVFSRKSAYFRSRKKIAMKERNWPTILLLVPSPQLLSPFLPLQPRKAGFELI